MIRLSPISRPSDLPVLNPLAELKPEPASPPGGPAELPLARGRERSAGSGEPGRSMPRLSASRTTGPIARSARRAALLLVAVLGTALPAAAQSVVTEVPSNWSLKPTAVTAGTQFRLLFLSSTMRNASSTDIADLQHLRPGPRRGRPHRHPGLQRGLPGGRLHRRHRRPRQHLHHLHQRPTRACPSTGSTAPRPPTSTRISTTGPGTTRPTTRTSPAPTAPTPSSPPTGPSPAATTTAPRRSPLATLRTRLEPSWSASVSPTAPLAVTVPSAPPTSEPT